jgi:hypothetical protein
VGGRAQGATGQVRMGSRLPIENGSQDGEGPCTHLVDEEGMQGHVKHARERVWQGRATRPGAGCVQQLQRSGGLSEGGWPLAVGQQRTQIASFERLRVPAVFLSGLSTGQPYPIRPL